MLNNLKQLNFFNKLLVIVIAGLFTATIVKVVSYKIWARYNYSIYFFSPEVYPVHVETFSFLTKDGHSVGTSYEPRSNYQSNWGNMESPTVCSTERLPLKFIIEYASYNDKKFYRDTIDMPYQLIDSVFRISKRDHIAKIIGNDNDQNDIRGLNFTVGIASKGNIVMWLQGNNYEITLLKHKIPVVKTLNRRFETKEELLPTGGYWSRSFSLSESAIAKISRGIDENANYADSSSKYLTHKITPQ